MTTGRINQVAEVDAPKCDTWHSTLDARNQTSGTNAPMPSRDADANSPVVLQIKTPARSQTLLLRPHALPAQPRPDPQRDQTTAAEQAFTRTFRSAPESASKPPTSNITSTLRLTAHASKLDSQQKEAPPAADTATDAPSAPHEEAQQGATRRIHRSAQAESCPGGNRSVLTAGAQPHTRHAYTRRASVRLWSSSY